MASTDLPFTTYDLRVPPSPKLPRIGRRSAVPFVAWPRTRGFFRLRVPAPLRGATEPIPMARKDEITGKGPVAGNHVSHAHNKAKRRFEVNLQKKRFFNPETGQWVTLRVSGQTIKTINKKGIAAVLRDAA